MAIRYPKEVHKFIQANYYGRRPEELAVCLEIKTKSRMGIGERAGS